MRYTEYQSDEIHHHEHLDQHLVKLCRVLLQARSQGPEFYGMVAAAVMDPDHNVVYGVNHLDTKGKRYHAERVAVSRYLEQYGEIPPGSIVLTTLSPCNEFMDERHGESCTDFLNSMGVKKVYCGYMDPSQTEDTPREFTLEETRNPDLRALCKEFADTFLNDDDLNEGWKDWAVAGALSLASLGAHAAVQTVKPGETVYSIARQHHINPVELMKLNNMNKNTKLEVGQTIKVPGADPKTKAVAKPTVSTAKPTAKPAVDPHSTKVQSLVQTKPVDPSTAYQILSQHAIKSGITDPVELAQFLAQCAAETGFFKHLGEIGRPALLVKKYKHSTGNRGKHDSLKYAGRGFIQLTGRGNYIDAGEDLNQDANKYLDHPELASDPHEAAKIAVWFWKKNVKRQVKDFSDTASVTRAINGSAAPKQEIEKRHNIFTQYMPSVKSWAAQRGRG